MSDSLKMEVLDHVSQMYLNPEVSDVTLVVNEVPIPGHRSVLASRSSYLKELLFGQPWEAFKTTGKIPIESVNDVEAFKAVLKFIYTGDVDLSDGCLPFLIEMIRLARMFSLCTLEETLKSQLKGLISIDNILKIYEVSLVFWYQDILAMCTDYIDNNAEAIMTHESFLSLSVDGLKSLLVRDSLKVREITIFLAVKNWLQEKTIGDDTKKDILSNIKLSYISPTDLMNVIKPSGLFSVKDIVNAILKLLSSCEDLAWNEFRSNGHPGLVKKSSKYEESRQRLLRDMFEFVNATMATNHISLKTLKSGEVDFIPAGEMVEYYRHPRTKKEVILTMDGKIITNNSTTTQQSVSRPPPTEVTKQVTLVPPPAKKTRMSLRKRKHIETE